MYVGMARMPVYPFVAWGTLLVLVCGTALAFVYLVGMKAGKRAAATYTNAWMLLMFGGCALIFVWALVTGQWAGFLREFGLAPMLEMLGLAVMFVAAMWWMAFVYVREKKE